MNERIEELAEQSWVYQIRVYEDNGVRTYGEREEVFSKEKFAELMLEDVLRIVGNGGEFCSRPKLIEQLKEHFGVEE